MENKTKRSLHYMLAVIGIIIGVAADQITKYLAVLYLKDQEPYIIIKNIFQLEYLENQGAAFGLFQKQTIFFVLSLIVISGVFIWFYAKVSMDRRYLPLRICAVFIMAGGIGNFIDRIRFHYVIDFFYFVLIDFPVFNVADIFVSVSSVALVGLLFFYYKEEDFEQLFHRGK